MHKKTIDRYSGFYIPMGFMYLFMGVTNFFIFGLNNLTYTFEVVCILSMTLLFLLGTGKLRVLHFYDLHMINREILYKRKIVYEEIVSIEYVRIISKVLKITTANRSYIIFNS